MTNNWPVLNVHAAPAMTWWMHRRVGLWFGLAAGVNVLLPDGCIKAAATDVSCKSESGPVWRTPKLVAHGGLGLEFRWDIPASSRTGEEKF